MLHDALEYLAVRKESANVMLAVRSLRLPNAETDEAAISRTRERASAASDAAIKFGNEDETRSVEELLEVKHGWNQLVSPVHYWDSS